MFHRINQKRIYIYAQLRHNQEKYRLVHKHIFRVSLIVDSVNVTKYPCFKCDDYDGIIFNSNKLQIKSI